MIGVIHSLLKRQIQRERALLKTYLNSGELSHMNTTRLRANSMAAEVTNNVSGVRRAYIDTSGNLDFKQPNELFNEGEVPLGLLNHDGTLPDNDNAWNEAVRGSSQNMTDAYGPIQSKNSHRTMYLLIINQENQPDPTNLESQYDPTHSVNATKNSVYRVHHTDVSRPLELIRAWSDGSVDITDHSTESIETVNIWSTRGAINFGPTTNSNNEYPSVPYINFQDYEFIVRFEHRAGQTYRIDQTEP